MKVTIAELEALFTANTDQIDQAEKKVQQTGERIERTPITAKVDADPRGALDGMARVEQSAKKLVSERASLKLDADIDRAERNLSRARERLEDLQVRAAGGMDVSADTRRAEASIRRLERHLSGLTSARAEIEVIADPADALADLQKVEQATKRVVSKDTAVRINANIRGAQKSIADLEAELDYLRALDSTVRVDADVRRAEQRLDGARAALRDLEGARAEMLVDVDDRPAKQKLEAVEDYAGEAGEEAGKEFGSNIVAALVSIPIAGAVIGIGAAAAKGLIQAFNDGLQVEVRQDRLEALTGISEAAAGRLARGAGEAYANLFGQSIEENMDIARMGVQYSLIDPEATSRDAQRVIEGLAGISDVLDGDVKRTSAAVATMLQAGVASSAEHAFDILAAGARNGVDRGEDLLDTFIEYPALFRKLGIDGSQAMGLLNQGLRAGARNSDFVADALKEFQIRATDASESSAKGFERIGLNAAEMTAKIARGGDEARQGLTEVLDGLRRMEDPVQRNAAAVELFGTKAEDLGDALFALDLSSAVDQLGQVEGAARRMFDTLADNDASRVEQAQRNIEVAADGIKGALAGVFAEPLGDFADWVSQNRGPLLQFFSDLANGAIDFGITATESFGSFVSGPLAEVVEGIAGVIDVFNGQEGRPKELDDLAESMRGFSDTTAAGVEGLEQLRGRFNSVMEGQIELGYLNDAALRTAAAVDRVGGAADGATVSDAKLWAQLRATKIALEEELAAAHAAGESQQNLSDRYSTTRAALEDQLVAMGKTREEAAALVEQYGLVPELVTTVVEAHTEEAEKAINEVARDRMARVFVDARTSGSYGDMLLGSAGYANGAVVELMAAGGIRGLTPMAPIAQAVPPNTWRVVGDRMRDREFYIPDDGSARSQAILLEAMHSFGMLPMRDGGVLGTTGPAQLTRVVEPHVTIDGSGLSAQEVLSLLREEIRAYLTSALGGG